MKLRSEGGARETSMQEALGNERVFIKTLAQCLNQAPFPCGLPTPLPKFIAILNLSGERMLVHSNSCSLIRLSAPVRASCPRASWPTRSTRCAASRFPA